MLHQYGTKEIPLVLRPLREEDIEEMRLWRNQAQIRENFIFGNVISPADQQAWFDKHKVTENDFVFIIEEIDLLHKKIGTVSIYNFSEETKRAEFGRFFIGEADARGRGYGIKTAKMACRIAFEQIGVNRLLLEVFKDNLTAYNLYKKIGFNEYDSYPLNGRTLIRMELNKSIEGNT